MIGIGGNLDSRHFGTPLDTCIAAVCALGAKEVTVLRRSRWYRSDPMPISNQPPFVNGVIEVATMHAPKQLLSVLHGVEAEFGRRRGVVNAARVLDLDLLTYNNQVSTSDPDVRLPHPRMHERAFVLKPFVELAPHWKHPIFGTSIIELLAQIPPGQVAEPIENQFPKTHSFEEGRLPQVDPVNAKRN